MIYIKRSLLEHRRLVCMKRIELGNNIFNFALSLYIIQTVGVFSSMEVKPFLGYMTYVILFLLVTKIFLSKYTLTQFFIIVFLLAFGVWLFNITEDGDLMILIWFIIAARDIELRKTFRVALEIYIVTILVGLLLFIFGFATDKTKMLANGTIGHSYGFTNANTLSVLIFQPILIWIFLRYKDFKLRDYSCILIIEIIVYYITKCRSTFITNIVLLFLIPNIKALSTHKYSKRILSILVLISPICTVLSYFAVYLYSQGGTVLNVLDILGSSRISSAYMNIIRYGIHFLPIANNPIYESLYTLDNSYIRIGAHFGIVVLTLIIYIYTRSMFLMYKREEYERLTVMATICILSLFETNLYRLGINIAILFLSEGLYTSVKDISFFDE